jgi:hypothetical protein
LHDDAQYNTLKDFIAITSVVDGRFIVTANPADPRSASARISAEIAQNADAIRRADISID